MLMSGPLWTCLTLMWLGSTSAHSLFICEPIKVHRCLGMPYNMTFFPNMMDHFDQDIASTYMKVSPKIKSQLNISKVKCMHLMASSTLIYQFANQGVDMLAPTLQMHVCTS